MNQKSLILLAVAGTLAASSALPAVSPSVDDADKKYIIIVRAPGEGMDQSRPQTINRDTIAEVMKPFKPRADSRVRIGVGFMFSPFRTTSGQMAQSMKNYLAATEELGVPTMIHLDLEHWWGARPDLWNWWDPSKPGYDPANRENVEWTHWAPDYAIRIAWRNWGRQVRVLPPPNYESPKYKQACREALDMIIPLIANWHKALPADKKHLLVGVKVGHESAIGVNAWYYPNGNDLLDKPASEDPRSGLVGADVLSRGVQQIGYAGLKTSGIRASGDITERDLYELAYRYMLFLCKEVAGHGIPRERLFTHGSGWRDGEMLYDAAVNEYSCPGWSFYAHAKDPLKEPAVRRNLAKTDAPYWGAVEWLMMGDATTDNQLEYVKAAANKERWKSALKHTLADKRARVVCVFNWEGIRKNTAAHIAMQEFMEESVPASNAAEK